MSLTAIPAEIVFQNKASDYKRFIPAAKNAIAAKKCTLPSTTDDPRLRRPCAGKEIINTEG
jgi:hypothetical protein